MVKRYGEFDGAWYDVDDMELPREAQVVLASDYDALQAKYDQLTGERFSDRVHAALQDRARRAEARINVLEAALYGAAESLATFRPPHNDNLPYWTELDEVTLHDAQRLCGKYAQSETEGNHGS